MKATNSFVIKLNVVEWQWNDFDIVTNPLMLATVYGNDTAIKTLKDKNGKVVAGLESFVEVTDEIAAKLKGLNAGDYTVTVMVLDIRTNVPIMSIQPFTQNGYDCAVKIRTIPVSVVKDFTEKARDKEEVEVALVYG